MLVRVSTTTLLLTTLLLGRVAVADDSVPNHQSDSVESARGGALQAAAWVKERLSGFHVTPARLMIGLGLLGALMSWNKNKRLRRWAILAGLSWLLLLGGLAAIVLGWRALA